MLALVVGADQAVEELCDVSPVELASLVEGEEAPRLVACIPAVHSTSIIKHFALGDNLAVPLPTTTFGFLIVMVAGVASRLSVSVRKSECFGCN
jgi:hypothetical protein